MNDAGTFVVLTCCNVLDILAWGNAFSVVSDAPSACFFQSLDATARRNTRAAN
jgi:hypothetical protein